MKKSFVNLHLILTSAQKQEYRHNLRCFQFLFIITEMYLQKIFQNFCSTILKYTLLTLYDEFLCTGTFKISYRICSTILVNILLTPYDGFLCTGNFLNQLFCSYIIHLMKKSFVNSYPISSSAQRRESRCNLINLHFLTIQKECTFNISYRICSTIVKYTLLTLYDGFLCTGNFLNQLFCS